MLRTGLLAPLCSLALLALPGRALALDLSFTGTFQQDDDVELIAFSVPLASNLTLATLSYSGGTNAAGAAIGAGGFDPTLTLFRADGRFIAENDDIAVPNLDARLVLVLGAGSYTLALTQYDNAALGRLADGFSRVGQGNFTAGGCFGAVSFCDDLGFQRTGHWAVDILNVQTPEPSSALLIGAALAALAARRARA